MWCHETSYLLALCVTLWRWYSQAARLIWEEFHSHRLHVFYGGVDIRVNKHRGQSVNLSSVTLTGVTFLQGTLVSLYLCCS